MRPTTEEQLDSVKLDQAREALAELPKRDNQILIFIAFFGSMIAIEAGAGLYLTGRLLEQLQWLKHGILGF